MWYMLKKIQNEKKIVRRKKERRKKERQKE